MLKRLKGSGDNKSCGVSLTVFGDSKAVTFEHVYRELNSEADRLANEAMDGKRSWIECGNRCPQDAIPLGRSNKIIKLTT